MKNTIALENHPSLSETLLKIRDNFIQGSESNEELIQLLDLTSAMVRTSEIHKKFFYNVRKTSASTTDSSISGKTSRLIDIFVVSMFSKNTDLEIRRAFCKLFESLFLNSKMLSGHCVETVVCHCQGKASTMSEEFGVFVPQALLNQLVNPRDLFSCEYAVRIFISCVHQQLENGKILKVIFCTGLSLDSFSKFSMPTCFFRLPYKACLLFMAFQISV